MIKLTRIGPKGDSPILVKDVLEVIPLALAEGCEVETSNGIYQVRESFEEIEALLNPPPKYNPDVYSFGELIMLMQT